jgi:hypothetical protein
MTAVVRSGRFDAAHHLTLDAAGHRMVVRTLCGRELTAEWSSPNVGAWLPVVCERCAASFRRRVEAVT